MADTPGGMQGAKLLTLRAQRGQENVVMRVKWRPQSSADLINEPRKELAAYAVQKLFLDEQEYVAPPTVTYCFPLAEYRQHAPGAKASFASIDCVLGFASYWLENVRTISSARSAGILGAGSGIWDAELFRSDAVYRRSVAAANLLTYVINHGDAHTEQFLVERGTRGIRAYVVDSSIAFLSIKNPMLLLREDWSNIQVPSLPKSALDRLRALTRDDVQRLATVAELHLNDRQLRNVDSPERSRKPREGTMDWDGPRLRIGLTPAEIDLVQTRIAALLGRPDLEKITER